MNVKSNHPLAEIIARKLFSFSTVPPKEQKKMILRAVKAAIEFHENETERIKDKLHKIKTWCEAYPVDIFPEPDMKKAHEVLEQSGLSLGSISASNMRHVLEGIQNIIEEGECSD